MNEFNDSYLDLIQKCIDAVEKEPELPDEMPDEMFAAITKDKSIASEALRILVRETKKGIKKRIECIPIPSGPPAPCDLEHNGSEFNTTDVLSLMQELLKSKRAQLSLGSTDASLPKRIKELEEQMSALALLDSIL